MELFKNKQGILKFIFTANIFLVIIISYHEETVMSMHIRDAVLGFIEINEKERKIIDLYEFQRLRYIKQLALTYYVYPGALHSRFEHSLGVMELASRIFDRLCVKRKKILRHNFSQIGLSIKEAKQILRLSALLHDVGHLPFSHVGEEVLPEGVKHEHVTIEIIKYLKPILDKTFFEGITEVIINILSKEETVKNLTILKRIISGSLDADRMDYLLRDSLYCGVEYGRYDWQRIIDCLDIIESESGGYDLCIEHGGVHALESMILARFYMFAQVYCHKTRKIYDYYLSHVMREWYNLFVKNLTDITRYNDISVLNFIENIVREGNNHLYEFAHRIKFRKQHSVIFETSDFCDLSQLINAKKVFDTLQEEFSDYEFILRETRGKIHNFLIKKPQKRENVGEKFYVLRNNRPYILTDESLIIRNIPKNFLNTRIYVAYKDKKYERMKESEIRKLIKKAEEIGRSFDNGKKI